MHFSLVKILLSEQSSSNCFDDVILPLRYALARLGYSVETRINSVNPRSVNILFGTCVASGIPDHSFPGNSIVFNLEQLTSPACRWNNSRYIGHMKRFAVWDYSARNVQYLRTEHDMGNVMQMRLGYVPEMTRLSRSFPHDIDVLFYGALSERRLRVLNELAATGLRVGRLGGSFGSMRDHAIARSRLVLNIHYYTPGTLELPRLGYLWANSKAVVSERNQDTEVFAGLDDACAYCRYDDLVPTVSALLADGAALTKQEDMGLRAFSALRQEVFLEAVVGRRVHRSGSVLRPAKLNAGSGKDFRQDSLNVDINPAMNPDVLMDLAQLLDFTKSYSTVRFGKVHFSPGSFTHIAALEVLEHVCDLPRLMRNFLDLLCDGGQLKITVPYELSTGAWQDPTHVRAFNENSWIYYTDWAWYMGWRDERFQLESLEYTLTAYGKNLAAEGMAMENIARSPRAVAGMTVILRKRKATPEEQEEFDLKTRAFYAGAVGEWSVADES